MVVRRPELSSGRFFCPSGHLSAASTRDQQLRVLVLVEVML